MAPYIAGLIIILVAVLLTVYKQAEAFSTEKTPSLYDAICSSKTSSEKPAVEKPVDVTKPKEETKAEKEKNELVEPTTPEFTKELENRISKSIATQLKDKMIVDRVTDASVADTSCPYAAYSSNATAQGSEFTQAKPNAGPDMSEYIRKDSIPCWNCSLP